MIKLSIIVPFYNVENYIEKCIRSLYVQDVPLDEYEVICVDDCSPDGSLAIVVNMQKIYPSLQLICHTENKRQGGARNTGLRFAKGEYVWFVDSDDYVVPNVLNSLIKIVKERNLDILQFNDDKVLLNDTCVMTGIEYAQMAKNTWSIRLPLMWRTLFRRSFLLDNRLSFVEHVQFEDTDFALRAYALAKRVMYKKNQAYIYCVHPESTVHRKNTPIKVYEQLLLLHRSSCVMNQVNDLDYYNLVNDYVRSELSVLGQQICKFNFQEKCTYAFMARNVSVKFLLKYTSFKNMLRIKFCICL